MGVPTNEKKRIAIIGDSYAFGWGVNNNETFSFQMNKLLMSASDGRMDVVNLEASGFNLIGYLKTLLVATLPIIIQG